MQGFQVPGSMRTEISANGRAVLLLTGPLVRAGRTAAKPLSPAEYHRLDRWLREEGKEPADLVAAGGSRLVEELPVALDRARIGTLLGRSAAARAACARWGERSIWTLCRRDPACPPGLERKLGEQAPPLLHGRGAWASGSGGGLAVVGSRNAGKRALGRAAQVGRLCAEAGRAVISGGARGVDRAATGGALEAGGRALVVLPGGLERAALDERHREPLGEGRLVLVSPFDPSVRFEAWRALARNKLIYALADAGLVVDTAHGRGGTWSGAGEQLGRFRSVPVYVCADGESERGVRGLLDRGALAWPDPRTPLELAEILDRARTPASEMLASARLSLEGGG